MISLIAQSLNLKYPPIAILWSDEKPDDALCFEKGRWGCVMGAFGAVAEKGRTAAFDRETFGCWGGGVGLGFGNKYAGFFGGVECFCRFLSSGNDKSDHGRAVAEQYAPFMRGQMREEFLHGEAYIKSPGLVARFLAALPIMEIPKRYVLLKPLLMLSDADEPIVIIFLANPDQLSALVVLANYARGDNENAIIPFAAGCQTIGIYPYREAKSPRPRAVVGLTDLSARKTIRRLGKDLMTFAVPLALFREMEQNVPNSFLERHTWQSLQRE